ncbi:MAG TPA: hypothetical protein VGI92_12660 [Gemmatimonadales bacterium]|jgi:predicted enzyme related to lactoylglutathione lyase
MLGAADIVAFLATAKPARAKTFYQDTLGLKLLSDDEVWLAPSGTRVAWFKDPDGNLLSLQQ